MFCKAKSAKKKLFLCGDFSPLPNKNVQIWDHLFPLLFFKDSESLNNIGHQTFGSGGKKTFKRYLKSEQTDRRTDRRTNRRTFWLIESIGPKDRCFENSMSRLTKIYNFLWSCALISSLPWAPIYGQLFVPSLAQNSPMGRRRAKTLKLCC